MNDIKVVKFNLHHKNNNNGHINSEKNFIEQNKIQIQDYDEKIEHNYTEDDLQKEEKNQKKEEQDKEQKDQSLYMKNNTKLRDIVENAIFSQLSGININFKYSGDKSAPINNKDMGNNLPKINKIELILLSQNDSISEFKKYGYGIYQFFYYLKILLITLGIILFFAGVYIYNIFFNFYRKYEEEYTLIYDSNLLLVISGTQIIRFRDFYIEIYGKKAFLEKFKYFDVFYQEYYFSFFFLFCLVILFNIINIIISYKDYQEFQEEHSLEHKTLILSGSDEPDEEIAKEVNEVNIIENSEEKNKEKKIMKKTKVFTENKIKEKIGVQDNIEIIFTKKCSDYYENLEKLDKLDEELSIAEYRIHKEKCCCHTFLCCTCCCLCDCCFCCNCWCCKNDKLNYLKDKIIGKKKEIAKQLDKIDEYEQENVQINPVYIISFKNTDDVDKVYKKYPSLYLWYKIKTCCKKKNTFFINKAPSPDDIVWKNLEFLKGYNYISSKLYILLLFLLHIFVSFLIQLFGEVADYYLEDAVDFFIINIIVSLILEKLDDSFGEMITEKLNDKFKYWSYSDITFYNILYQSIFKAINKGAFPFLTYITTNWAYNKWFHKEYETDYASLVSKIFIIIEMNGFGYPFIDWLFNIVPKLKEFKESSEKVLSIENIEKEIKKLTDNNEGLSSYELNQEFKKKNFDLEGNYSDILSSYWITMFYFPIYPFGIIQTIFNLLFKFITEKSLLINVYQRPNYTNPSFGFFCLNYFNFGIFLYFLGNIIFFRNEDNKSCFGLFYILIMVFVFILPVFFVLARLIVALTNCCCSKERKNQNKNDFIAIDPKVAYDIFNPLTQREKLEKLINDYFSNIKHGHTSFYQSQKEGLIAQLNKMEKRDLYTLQDKFRIPKYNMHFEMENDDKYFENKEQKEFYYLLIQLGFLPYNEIGSDINIEPLPKITCQSLRKLTIKEIISNNESSKFCFDNQKNELTMAYIKNKTEIVIYDVFKRDSKSFTNNGETISNITCFSFQKSQYLVTITLHNDMTIYNITEDKKVRTIGKIGDNFIREEKPGLFGLSSVENNNSILIITSYYKNEYFKIFDFNKLMNDSTNNYNILINNPLNNQNNIMNNQIMINQIIQTKDNNYIKIDNQKENILSLQTAIYNKNFALICVRSEKSINLFINDIDFPIKKILLPYYNSYINFKLLPAKYYEKSFYLIISIIKDDLSSYKIQILNLFELFTNEFLANLSKLNNEKNNNNNDKQIIIDKDNLYNIQPYLKNEFNVTLNSVDEKVRKERKKSIENNDEEKFNLGNILFWEKDYLIISTPFDFLHIINYQLNNIGGYIKPEGIIHNKEKVQENGKNKENVDSVNIITYNISERIDDPLYGSCFIMGDNKGNIQYIRPSKDKEKLNISTRKKNIHFDDFSDKVKFSRVRYSAKFFLYYYLMHILFSTWFALYSHKLEKNEETKKQEKKCLDYTIAFLVCHILFSFIIKGCVYDAKVLKSLIGALIFPANCFFSVGIYCTSFYLLCYENKTVIYFIASLNLFYLAHIIFFFCVYCGKKKYLLRIYLLGFMFYQISRLCIIICFMILVSADIENFEIYIYIIILAIISAYMFYVNYLNTLQKEIIYRFKLQGIFNYNFEWMNVFCFCDSKKSYDNNNNDYDNDKCYTNPRKCIKNNEINCYIPIDNWCIKQLGKCCNIQKEEKIERNARQNCMNCACCDCEECCERNCECNDYYD